MPTEQTKALVYYWKECSLPNLLQAVAKVQSNLSGKIAVKVHTGEPHGPNIIPPAWVKEVVNTLPQATAVECNVLYDSPRKHSATHREALLTNNYEIQVDIMDADGDTPLPVHNGFHLHEVAVGSHMLDYNSLLILTHFKGHAMGGFGGSLKNIAIGCASGRLGKKQVHGVDKPGAAEKSYLEWPMGPWFMEAMADSGKAILDFFQGKYACINVLRRMSVDCDCVGVGAAEPTTPDLGILASTDILAIDQAAIDLIYALPEHDKHDLVERIESRQGLRQLSAMAEIGLGTANYELKLM
ncbi:MAG: DUF362 domain-containing protein [Desulfovibrionaceae bacterium]|nr:DUF362 domain-containing protein [Desulfovibrionaceae bacterium]